MICFRDRTFCESPCINEKCGRRWTDELAAEAERWWGKPGAPVAFAPFAAQGCQDHKPPAVEQ